MRTMKTLIVFLFSTANTITAARLPIEVFELRETNDNQLYVKSNNEDYPQHDETKLTKILKPYIRTNDDEITNKLIAKVKVLRKNKQGNNVFQQDIYFINGDMLDGHDNIYGYNYDDNDGFIDETRNQRLPQNRMNVYKRPVNILRMEDRTAAPRHKYYYDKEEDDRRK